MPKIGGPSKNSIYFSVQTSIDEKTILDHAVKESGLSRNAFLRRFINSLVKQSGKDWQQVELGREAA